MATNPCSEHSRRALICVHVGDARHHHYCVLIIISLQDHHRTPSLPSSFSYFLHSTGPSSERRSKWYETFEWFVLAPFLVERRVLLYRIMTGYNRNRSTTRARLPLVHRACVWAQCGINTPYWTMLLRYKCKRENSYNMWAEDRALCPRLFLQLRSQGDSSAATYRAR